MNIMQQRAIERLNGKQRLNGSGSNDMDERPVYILTPDVIMYDVQDVMKMTGYSKKTVLKLFNDPELPKLNIGKKLLVEAHALIDYCARSHDKYEDEYWQET